jgi:hypothetical protein
MYLLSQFTSLTSTAAAIALNAGHPAYIALQLLESGRAIITNQQLESSMGTVFLEQIQPDVATKICDATTRFGERIRNSLTRVGHDRE